ncbi:CatA-like O-acetyltransferase [Anaerofustis stercorihominis]|uniref:Chloramphenicol O-acetyltransferase n=1 Tax=Anaerofustis stercorihominis DSM 17244 TaxID=445971 RepID=B1C5Q8_9FIRM|nr:CatA-like O-acetyltransferase [Anaerofustis stercorihominis]EDS73622.1 chloramphenicol O-acetyltransferase [Anaerofustis stercorihominis DSM 17244]MCQ4794714.1 CatA-like O-acetyltransferase [Anaerofustis stercorihominis]
MSNNYREVDLNTWDRKIHHDIFRNSVEPFFCVSFEVDITKFLDMVKKNKYSFTLAFIYALAKCANEIEQFKYRFLDEKVVIYDKINTSFTYLNKETELFKMVDMELTDTMDEYIKKAYEKANEQKEYFVSPPGNDIFQFSPFPWISFLNISHTNSGNKNNAVPIFDFGKYQLKGDRIIIPLSVHAHHSFVDGIHIGKFYDLLTAYLNSF